MWELLDHHLLPATAFTGLMSSVTVHDVLNLQPVTPAGCNWVFPSVQGSSTTASRGGRAEVAHLAVSARQGLVAQVWSLLPAMSVHVCIELEP